MFIPMQNEYLDRRMRRAQGVHFGAINGEDAYNGALADAVRELAAWVKAEGLARDMHKPLNGIEDMMRRDKKVPALCDHLRACARCDPDDPNRQRYIIKAYNDLIGRLGEYTMLDERG